MKEAIEISTRGLCRKCTKRLDSLPYFLVANLIGRYCDDCCYQFLMERMKSPRIIYHRDTKTSDSPDTEYKIELTEWIEGKEQREAVDKYNKIVTGLFSPQTLEEAEQIVKENEETIIANLKKCGTWGYHFKPLDHEEGEG